jgi:TonB family protein
MAENWQGLIGQVVDGTFSLRQYLGGSDHRAVFLTDRRSGSVPQTAAIKLITRGLSDQEIQFVLWERVIKLSHPNLIALFQTGRCQLEGTEMLFLVMEYAEENLSQILPYRPLTPAELREMLHPVLAALGYVHNQGFVHGHLKPANIMAINDQVKLSSDELCQACESSSVGDPSAIYVAPEVASGGALSPAADVWSLGVTIVEALTQHPPVFQGPSRSELRVPETMPAPFLEIVNHCLNPNPKLRWTLPEISASLQPGSVTRQPTAIARARGPAGSRRFIVPVVATGLLLLAIFAGSKLIKHTPDTAPSNQTKVDAAESKTSEPNAVTGESSSRVATPQGTTQKTIGSVARGTVAQQVLPDVSRGARNSIQGRVRVKIKVRVDTAGDVVGAQFVSPGPSKYFANLALNAARRWKFTPPQLGAQNLSSEWLLKFEFGRAATNVQATQSSP